MARPPPPSPITRLDLRQLYRALLRAHAAAPPPPAPPPPSAVATLSAYRKALYVRWVGEGQMCSVDRRGWSTWCWFFGGGGGGWVGGAWRLRSVHPLAIRFPHHALTRLPRPAASIALVSPPHCTPFLMCLLLPLPLFSWHWLALERHDGTRLAGILPPVRPRPPVSPRQTRAGPCRCSPSLLRRAPRARRRQAGSCAGQPVGPRPPLGDAVGGGSSASRRGQGWGRATVHRTVRAANDGRGGSASRAVCRIERRLQRGRKGRSV